MGFDCRWDWDYTRIASVARCDAMQAGGVMGLRQTTGKTEGELGRDGGGQNK